MFKILTLTALLSSLLACQSSPTKSRKYASSANEKKISEKDFNKTYLETHRDLCLSFSEGKGNTKKLLDIMNYGYKHSQYRFLLEDMFNVKLEVLRSCTDVATALTFFSRNSLIPRLQLPTDKSELSYKLKRYIDYRLLDGMSWEEYEEAEGLNLLNLKSLEGIFNRADRAEKVAISHLMITYFNTFGLKELDQIYSSK